MMSVRSSGRRFGVLLAASLHVAGSAPPEPPRDYSLEARYFHGQPDDPSPVTKIYVSGEWHRLETYVDGALRSTEISRPDRKVVYVISEALRTYQETSFDALKAGGWSPRGHPSVAEYREKAQKGTLVLTSLGSETVNGQACAKYSITYPNGGAQFHFWVSAATGLPVVQVIQTRGKSRIEWSQPKVGPQPGALFELPPGYRKVQ
jgi:hypothetical protein